MSSPASSPSAPPDTGTRHITATVLPACPGVFVSYQPAVGVSVVLPVTQQALDASTAGLERITDALIPPTAALLPTAAWWVTCTAALGPGLTLGPVVNGVRAAATAGRRPGP